MAKTSSNVMISDFKEWLKGNGNLTPNSANSYISYLGVSYNNDLSLVSTDNVYSRSLKTIFQHKVYTDKLYADSFYKVQK
ncbi:MAG: hypothetical protein HXO36_11325, partial [Prevotella sp.]